MSVSIIIRTRDEEFWIGRCLSAIAQQSFSGRVEVILVDNGSTDRTIDRALAGFDDIKILALEKYNPSVALNIGVAASSCDYCVCLSAHCVPESDLWLESLVAPLRDDQQIAATYGRQLPLPSSSPRDKRDLWLTFGLDDVLQKKEPFLHNANAAYRTCDLLEEPFDEQLSNIEDRSWGHAQLQKGRYIRYVSDACVYHDHGIHQTGDGDRLRGVISMMDKIHNSATSRDMYYGSLGPRMCASKVLLVPLSERYGIVDIENLSCKLGAIEKAFQGWDVLALPSSSAQLDAIADIVQTSEIRIRSPQRYGGALVADIACAVSDLADQGLFWDFFGFFDIRGEVPAEQQVVEAEALIMSEGTDFAFIGRRTFVAAEARETDNIHVLPESGWHAYFKTEQLKSTVEIIPNRLCVFRAGALDNSTSVFSNYSVVIDR